MKSDVVIVLKHSTDAAEVIGAICGRNGVIHDLDTDHGVIEATLAAEHVADLQNHPGVSYVRPVLSYCDAA